MEPSESESNLENNLRASIPVFSNHSPSTDNTSSATKNTPHSGQLFESSGTNELHAPHSPKASSETPENPIPHSGHFLESSGIIALHEPHSAIGTSLVSVSDTATPNYGNTTHDIMIDRQNRLKCIYDWSYS